MKKTTKKETSKALPSTTQTKQESSQTDTQIQDLKPAHQKQLFKIGEEIVALMLENAIRSGHIDTKGKSAEQLRELFLQYLKDWDRTKPILFGTDHTKSVLTQARLFVKSQQMEFAILFYATWFEHWLNRIIRDSAAKRDILEREIEQMIRDIPSRAKMSWLLSLLGLQAIQPPHKKRVELLLEKRNSFVHYKWKVQDIDNQQERKEQARALKDIEPTVEYLLRYETRYVRSHSTRKIKRILSVQALC